MTDWKKLLDDTIGQIGGAAQAAGQGLRTAASEAGKVVGIGVGSLEVRPTRTTYAFGQTIRGVVVLQLAEPVAARRLTVSVRATRQRRVHRRDHGPILETEVVHEFTLELAGEQTYTSGEHEFAAPLPEQVESRVEVDGLLGDVLKVGRAFKSMADGALRWRLVATLEIPWKRNLAKGIDLHVRAARGDEHEEVPPPPAAKPPPKKPPPEKPAAATPPTAKTTPAAAPPTPAPTPKPAPTPTPVPEPIAADGWLTALSRVLCALQGQGWVILHHWAGPPVRSEAVFEVLARHPDLDPELLLFHGVMDGLELVVGRPRTHGGSETVRRAREAAASRGGRLGALGKLGEHPQLAGPLADEFVTSGPDAVRVLELPTLERLFGEHEDFPRRDGRSVIFGAAVRGPGDYFGVTRADEIARWRTPDRQAYPALLQQRSRERPGQVWWVVRGQDHGASLRDPPALLRWSEMLAVCLQELEHGER